MQRREAEGRLVAASRPGEPGEKQQEPAALGAAAGLAIRTIAVLVDSVPEAVLCSRMDLGIPVVAVSGLESAELLVWVGPGAKPKVLVRYISIPIQVVVVVALAVGVQSIVGSVGCARVHACVVVIAVHFIRPGVAVFVDAVVERHISRIGPSLCLCRWDEPNGENQTKTEDS